MSPMAFFQDSFTNNDWIRNAVAEGLDMEQHPYGWLSLVPPMVAILLAIVTRRILISLFLAVLSGALILTFHESPANAVPTPDAFGGYLPGIVIDAGKSVASGIADAWNDHLWPTLIDADKVSVFVFTCLMGAIVGMVNRAAGMRGLLQLLAPLTGSVRRTQMVAWFSGMLVFFDDYANTMLLGTTFRSMFDRLKISREKLAYIVDSTAAPVAGLAIVSTWIAGEIGYINDGLSIGFAQQPDVNAFDLFLQSIPYRFYVLWALFFVVLLAVTRRDFGPMLKAEIRARRSTGNSAHENAEFLLPGDLDWERMELSRDQLDARTVEALAVANDPTLAPSGTRARSWNAILPILVTVIAILWFMFQSGYQKIGPLPQPNGSASVLTAPVASPLTPVVFRQDDPAPTQPATAAEDQVDETEADETEAVAEDEAADVPSVEEPSSESATWRVTQWLRDIFGESNSYSSLVWGSLVGFFFTLIWLAVQRVVPFAALTHAAGTGAAQMVPALLVLWLASTLSAMTSNSPTPAYQAQLDEAMHMAEAIASADQIPKFDDLDEENRVHEALHLHHLDRGVIVQVLAPAYDDPEAFLREVLEQVNSIQPDGSFYSRYLYQDGVQVDWNQALKQESAVPPSDEGAQDEASDDERTDDQSSEEENTDEPGENTPTVAADTPITGSPRNGLNPSGDSVGGFWMVTLDQVQDPAVDAPPRPRTRPQDSQTNASDSETQESGVQDSGQPAEGADRPQQPGNRTIGPGGGAPGGRPQAGGPGAGGPAAGGQGGGNRSMAGMFAGQGPAEPDLRESWKPEGNLRFPFADYRHRLHTGQYLSSLLTRQADTSNPASGSHPLTPWLPTIIFVLAGFTAFATGSSWGTMGIVMPLAIPLATSILSGSDMEIAQSSIFLATIGSVLAGAVFGDHCSPISDTTVLSSQASGCDHLAHVWTQMPYALSVGLVTIVFGTIPVGFGFPWQLCLILGTISLIVIAIFMGRRAEDCLDE